MRRRALAAAAVAAAGLTLAGCRPSTPTASGKSTPAGRVRVRLPDGWAAQTASDEHLEVGPPGRSVLRIDLKQGMGGQLPTPDALEKELSKSFPPGALRQVDALDRDGVALLVVAVRARSADAGTESLYQLLGAKRVGDDLFLCASLPGAAEDEVKRAARACEDVEKPGTP